jgi:hypothetical protein
LFFNVASEYATWTAQKNQVGMKLIRTHQLLVHAETLIDSSRMVVLEVKAEKTLTTMQEKS